MSATVGQGMVYHEADKRPLWNDEDALLMAGGAGETSPPRSPAEPPSRPEPGQENTTFPMPWSSA
jgi:hypothetical protein